MLNIVLFGPPGAGKGTQSAKLVEKYQLIHLSTGDILRGEIAAGTILGQEAKILMDQGILVPDEIVITMINNKLEKNSEAKGFIFDGFPRTTAQANALDKLLNIKGTKISMTLALEVSSEELTKRLLQRGMESGRVDDQDEKTIRNRVMEYENKTAPLKAYYTGQNKFYSVDGIGSVEKIFISLCSHIDPIYVGQAINSPDISNQARPTVVVSEDNSFHNHIEKVKPTLQVLNKEPFIEKKIEKTIDPIIEKFEVKTEHKKIVEKKKVSKKSPAKAKSNIKKIPIKKTAPKKKKSVKNLVSRKPVKKKVSGKKPKTLTKHKTAKPLTKKPGKKKGIVKKKITAKKKTAGKKKFRR